MHQLESIGRVWSLNFSLKCEEFVICQVSLTIQGSLCRVIPLVNFLAVVKKETSSSIGRITEDKILLNDLRWQLIRIGQVARVFAIFFTSPLICQIFRWITRLRNLLDSILGF